MTSPWTEERTAKLVELWHAGMYCEAIGRALRPSCSATSVRKKAASLGLELRKPGWIQWPEQWSADLRDLWATGVSAGIITRRLNEKHGCALTRNAVLGKIHRLNLAGRVTKVSEPRPKREKKPRRPTWSAKRVASRVKPPTRIKEPPPPPVESLMLSIYELDNPHLPMMCRYIDGDPKAAHSYCGNRTQAGSSYCQFHHRLCWTPITRRQKAELVDHKDGHQARVFA